MKDRAVNMKPNPVSKEAHQTRSIEHKKTLSHAPLTSLKTNSLCINKILMRRRLWKGNQRAGEAPCLKSQRLPRVNLAKEA
jgi:hypothetical protein